MQRSIWMVFLVFLGLLSCQKSKELPKTINGSWQSIGSGWALQIKDSSDYALYDITSISCLPNSQGKYKELANSLSLKEDTLYLKKGVITYSFVRTALLPTLCTSPPTASYTDPLYNFEVFAETVENHYAFFKLNAIDWDDLYSKQKAKLSSKSKDVELYEVIDETLELLNDNHAYLEATDEVYKSLEQLESNDNKDDKITTGLTEYGDFQVAEAVAEHHLQEDMTEDSWLIQWGLMTEEIGYIQIKAMWLYADLEISQALIDEIGYVDAYVETFNNMNEGNYIEKEVRGVRSIMERVMKDLSTTESIIIDVRFNGGGQDAVSFEILSHFIQQDKLKVANQKLRHKDGYTKVLPLYVKSKDQIYSKPVYVLTSQQTGSAAEAFAIATVAMRHVKRIGSSTSGALSTALEKVLPNGWAFSISNEIYMDIHGENYENTGIPPDYQIKYAKDRQEFFRSVMDDLDADRTSIFNSITKEQ